MRLSVAIPESSLSDESLKVDKTRKVSVLARACAIFKIDTIYVYREGQNKQDGSLMVMILRYLETPQFLRKRMFPKVNDLKFAGVLQPLKIASHVTLADPKKIKRGDIREGMTLSIKGKKFVDVGTDRLIPFFGKTPTGKRVTVQFKEGHPKFSLKEISRSEVPEYWGYSVRERASLFSLIDEWKGRVIITSRKGKIATAEQLSGHVKKSKEEDEKAPLLIVFGSPEKGVHEILGSKIRNLQNAKSLNFFPDQATETIRLEEALLGTLAIINSQRASS